MTVTGTAHGSDETCGNDGDENRTHGSDQNCRQDALAEATKKILAGCLARQQRIRYNPQCIVQQGDTCLTRFAFYSAFALTYLWTPSQPSHVKSATTSSV